MKASGAYSKAAAAARWAKSAGQGVAHNIGQLKVIWPLPEDSGLADDLKSLGDDLDRVAKMLDALLDRTADVVDKHITAHRASARPDRAMSFKRSDRVDRTPK